MGKSRKFWAAVRVSFRVFVPDMWKYGLYTMLVSPLDKGTSEKRNNSLFPWLLGWSWALAGLVAGALAAPSLVQFVGLADTPYQDWLVIGVALVAGFVVQLVGWSLLALPLGVSYFNRIDSMTDGELQKIGLVRLDKSRQPVKRNPAIMGCWVPLSILLPFAGVGYGVYRYLTLVGVGQREVTVAFVGGLLIKTFLIPFIKGLVTGAIFRWFIRWLRGDKAKAKGA